MIKAQISDVKVLLSSPQNIVIVPHRNPDGDAMGSTLGLYHYLKTYNHNVVVIAPNDYPDFLKWLPGDDRVLKFESQRSESKTLIEKADLLFTLDFNAFHRTGNDMAEVLEASSNNNFIESEKLNNILQPVHTAMFLESNPSPVKYAASLLGLCDPDVRLPLVQVQNETKKKVLEALKVAKIL